MVGEKLRRCSRRKIIQSQAKAHCIFVLTELGSLAIMVKMNLFWTGEAFPEKRTSSSPAKQLCEKEIEECCKVLMSLW